MKIPILKSLCYFDIFNHPLKKEELFRLCGSNGERADFDKAIQILLQEQACFEYKNFYGISPSIKEQIKERIKKEEFAKSYIEKLPFYTRIIKSFPFVRGVSISGSLSKGVMYEKGDIDYFIITKKNRLWICRSLLVVFKKVFLLNSRKYFCVNYFVDEDNTQIIDKNIFTAVEVSHLIPTYNEAVIQKMKDNNSWIQDYFPNYSPSPFFPSLKGEGLLKRILEGILVGQLAERLDLFLMRVTYKRWTKKFKNFNPEKMELTMRSNRGISKHHPSDYQTKVLAAYKERTEKLNIGDEGFIYS
ncbi:MAG: hypothetical protein JKY48_16445 [Flavobacteriales bacterium]|nr:hypothetical protein [Flavobacteriales bacterium]